MPRLYHYALAVSLAWMATSTMAGVNEGDEVFRQIQQLTAPVDGDGAPSDRLGQSVDISGDFLIASVPDDDDVQTPGASVFADSSAGSAVIFQRSATDPTNWERVTKLLPQSPSQAFGFDVAIDGDVAVVAARSSSDGTSQAGAVYVFERDAGGPDQWGQVKILLASDAQPTDFFGQSVQVAGDTIVVGAPGEDEIEASAGAAYVFQRDLGGASNWGEVTKLLPDPSRATQMLYNFGQSVAVFQDEIAVGATGDDEQGSNSGAVYVFERNQGGANAWGRIALLDGGPSVQTSATVGSAVALEGEWLVAGAQGRDTAFIFQKTANTWSLLKELPNDFQGGETRYGESVAISGDLIAVGDGLSPPDRNGAVAVYQRNEGGSNQWGLIADLFASDPLRGLDFGIDVSIDGNTLVGGAPGDDEHTVNGGLSGSGAVFVFDQTGLGSGTFAETAKITLGASGSESRFGNSVAVSGRYLLVGAPNARNLGESSGAVFLFERTNGTWQFLKTLQPSSVNPRDEFGYMVDISNDTCVVLLQGNSVPKKAFVFAKNQGGPNNWGEQAMVEAQSNSGQNTIEIDGDTLALGEWNGTNDTGDRTGAVQIFGRNAGGVNSWGLVRKISPDDVTSAVQFGWSIDLDADLLAVGARGDDEAAQDAGAGYLFQRNAGGIDQWGQIDKLTPSAADSDQLAGSSIAIRGDTVILGAPGRQSSQGAIYIFTSPAAGTPASYSELLRIDSPIPQNSGRFGAFLKLSENIVVVSDPGYRDAEVSTTNAVGAALVFERNLEGENNWGLRKRLLADDRAASDGFSSVVNSAFTNRGAVGFDGKTVVVGAHGVDTLNANVGAAYVFFTENLFSNGFEQP